MKTTILLMAMAIIGTPFSHAATTILREADGQAKLEVDATLSDGCDKLCIYDLLIRKILSNTTGRDLEIGTTLQTRIDSFVRLPKNSFVVTLERSGDNWIVAPKQMCSLKGGKFEPHGLGPTHICIHKFADGGRVCTDHSQCLGTCLVQYKGGGFPKAGTPAKGECQRDSNPYGCKAGVQDGKVSGTMCKD